jgi:hypothetical protein
MVEAMVGMGYPLYFMTIIGLAKMAGVVVVLVPDWPRLKEWAYAGITFNLMGAAASHAFSGDGFDHAVRPIGILALGLSARGDGDPLRERVRRPWRLKRLKRTRRCEPACATVSGGQRMTHFKRFAAVAVLFLVGVGCGGPMLVFPGGALSGEVVTEAVPDWSFVTAAFVDIEFRPEDPYSVQLNYLVKDGILYIDPKEGRRWFDYLREDPRVRARFDERVYQLTAVLVGRPGELEGFDPDRFIYRLDARR